MGAALVVSAAEPPLSGLWKGLALSGVEGCGFRLSLTRGLDLVARPIPRSVVASLYPERSALVAPRTISRGRSTCPGPAGKIPRLAERIPPVPSKVAGARNPSNPRALDTALVSQKRCVSIALRSPFSLYRKESSSRDSMVSNSFASRSRFSLSEASFRYSFLPSSQFWNLMT